MSVVFWSAAAEDWQAGKVSGTVYSGDEKLTQLIAKVGLVLPVCPHLLFSLLLMNKQQLMASVGLVLLVCLHTLFRLLASDTITNSKRKT